MTVTHLEPPLQPSGVRDVSERLFSAYQLDDGGSVQLAGCQLESRPFIRIGFWDGAVRAEIYLNESGEEASPELVKRLELIRAVPAKQQAGLGWDVERHLNNGRRLLSQRLGGRDVQESETDAAMIWCRYATGKLRFSFDEHSAELAFEDWASLLKAPPYECPYTGEKSFHLAADDKGHVAAAEGIHTCAATGKRVLATETLLCSVSKKHVLREFIATCPVSGENVWGKLLIPCRLCRQPVSPKTILRGRCSACRNLQPITADQTPLCEVLERSPELREWKNWSLGKTSAAYILVAHGWVKRCLFLLDRETLEPIRALSGNRFGSHWAETRYEWSSPQGVPPHHMSDKLLDTATAAHSADNAFDVDSTQSQSSDPAPDEEAPEARSDEP
jgi:hypothetical protein